VAKLRTAMSISLEELFKSCRYLLICS
jgi:hypothetical protein